jgi:hypothetical protein
LIAAAAATNRDRGSVISAYADRQIYAAETITINYRGGNYAVGDSLQYAAGLADVLIVVTEIGSGDSIEAFTVSSKGASLDDFAGTDLPFTTSGAGTLATFDIATAQEAGRKLSDVVSPKNGDMVQVSLDETHNNEGWDWVFADTNGDGISNWIALRPSGKRRNFYTDPIQTAEIDGKAITDGKIADYTTDTAIVESNSKFLGGVIYTFTELKKALVAKINALFTNKLDKVTSTAQLERAYIVTPEGGQSLYPINQAAPTPDTIPFRGSYGEVKTAWPYQDEDATNMGYVNNLTANFIESVDGVTGEGSRNVQLTALMTKAEFDALEDPVGSGLYPSLKGKTVILTDVYPDQSAYSIGRPDLWPTGTEIAFGNNLYGKRQITGTTDTTAYQTVQVFTANDVIHLVNAGGDVAFYDVSGTVKTRILVGQNYHGWMNGTVPEYPFRYNVIVGTNDQLFTAWIHATTRIAGTLSADVWVLYKK